MRTNTLPVDYPRVRNKKVLVTGGAGFIGSNLCEDFLQYENEVWCLDNFATGSKENLSEFLDHPKFHLLEGDIRDLTTCQNACKGMDLVYNEAAICSVPRSIDDPMTSHTANIDGFMNMLIAVRDQGVKRLVYAASSSAYGDSNKLPKVEGEEGTPLSPYALTKYVNELYAGVFHLNYGIETIGLRYFNVFGRRQSPKGAYSAVIPKFIDQLLKHESPVINGDGTFSRDFTYIDNVIQMNHLAGVTKNPAALGQVFNTAAGKRTSLNELIEVIQRELAKFDAEIESINTIYGSTRKGDIPHSWASVEKAKDILGYLPNENLNEQLISTIEWNRNTNNK